MGYDEVRALCKWANPVAKGAGSGVSGEALGVALDELEWDRWLVVDTRGYSFVARFVRDVVLRDMVTKGQRARIAASLDPGD